MTALNEQPDDRRSSIYHLLAVALCAFLLVLPALLNRAPFLYFDSGAYLNLAPKAVQMLEGRLGLAGTDEADAAPGASSTPTTSMASDDRILAGRSIYYGFLAWSGAETLGTGTVVVLQALVLAMLVTLTLRVVWPEAPATSSVVAAVTLAGGLTFLTSAGFFVSLVMPDIWAGMMVLAFALLVAGGPALGRSGRAALGVVMALAVLFHNSHLLLLAALICLLGLAMLRQRWRRIVPPSRLALPAAALACGLAGQAAFSLAVTGVTGQPPVTMPFVTAHLVEMGPGTRLAHETCPHSGFEICRYRDRLPTDWISFLFSYDPRTGVFKTVPPSVQRALSEEQARFALATLAAEPLATTGGLMRDGVAQLWRLSLEDVPLTAADETFLAANFTEEVADMTRDSAVWNHAWAASALSRLIQASTAAAAAGLFVMVLARRLPSQGPLAILLLLCVIGLVLNALICGVLASPYGRFQARVAWLLPFLLALTVLTARSRASASSKELSHDIV